MGLSRRRDALVRRLHHRKTREREGLFLVEGVRGVRAALAAGADIRFVLRSPRLAERPGGRELAGGLESAGVEVEAVEDDVLATLGDTGTHQGVLAVCVQPDSFFDSASDLPRVLVLDAVQDPGNAGTLIRAAGAFGVGLVVALDGTVDPWAPRTVRATAGAIVSVRVVTARSDEALARLRGAGHRVLVADVRGTPVEQVSAGPPWALVVGNEGRGVRREVVEAAAGTVAVPMSGRVESLNVGIAGSILMYALTLDGMSS